MEKKLPKNIFDLIKFSKNGLVSELVNELKKYPIDTINIIINCKIKDTVNGKIKWSIKEQAINYWKNERNNSYMIDEIIKLIENENIIELNVLNLSKYNGPSTKIETKQFKNTLEQNEIQENKYKLKGKPFISTDGSYLLIPNQDKDIIFTYYRTFGSDYIPVIIHGDSIVFNDIKPSYWLVWKIPGDLSTIITMPQCIIYKLCKYNGLIGKRVETKKRTLTPTKEHLHFPEYDDGTKYAMISSSIFIRIALGFRSQKIDIKAVPCHRTAHALIFQHSPRVFAYILRDNPDILNFLESKVAFFGGEPKEIKQWSNAFIEYFTKHIQ
jgi:hypothetical protein